jgi:preprotein translocase subunit SecB
MADETRPPESAQPGGNGDGADGPDGPAPSLLIAAQYIKDLSFENPHAPASLAHESQQPHGDVAIQVKSRHLGDDDYEVILEFNVKATQGDEVAFLVELAYGGVFRVQGFDDATRELAIMVECPRILFPFARRIIADSVRDGGFPPLMLAPIDFLALYQRRLHAAANTDVEADAEG